MNYLSSNYRSRMHKCYVINGNKTLSITWTMIKAFLEDITVIHNLNYFRSIKYILKAVHFHYYNMQILNNWKRNMEELPMINQIIFGTSYHY